MVTATILHLLQPLPISPLNPLHHLQLLIAALIHVHQVVEVFNKLPLHVTGYQGHTSLSKKVYLAKEQTMILVG